MVNCLDVDANKLINVLAVELEKMNIEKPKYAGLVKTGSHTERPPTQDNFWYLRCASVMRQAYSRATVGTNRLRRHYGGRKNRGLKPEKHRPSGGSLIRNALQSLEKAGLLEKSTSGGRKLTSKGTSLLDKCAKAIKSKSNN